VTQAPELVRLALKRRKERLEAKVRRRKVRIGDKHAIEKVVPPHPGPLPRGEGEPPLGIAPLIEVNVRPQYIPDYATPRFRLTPRHFAYLKIAEGCNHPCSFCIIPRMRGAHRSRVQADIVEEAKALIGEGVKE